MSTGLSEKVFETILQKIKVENQELVVADDDVSDLEDITEKDVIQQNTICKKAIPSNNEKVSSITETNSQKPKNENKCVSRRTRYMKRKSHSSHNKNLEIIPPRNSKTSHKCSERCNWCCSIEAIDPPVHTEQLQNAILKNSHTMTPAYEGSRIENIQSESPFNQNTCLKSRKKLSSCSIANCYQDAIHTLSVYENIIFQKIFSEFNFPFFIESVYVSTSKLKRHKSSLAFCNEHLQLINVITICQLCSNKVEKLDFEDYKKYDHWNSILLNFNILLTLQPGMFICLTCKSCITDNDFLSPVNLKCLQENVKEKNSERIKTFGIINHTSTVAKKSKCMDLKVTFSEPLVTSTCVFDRSIDNINKKKVIKNLKSGPNKRINKIMNLLTNTDLEPERENSDISEPNDETQIKPEEEINPFEFLTKLDLKPEEESDMELDYKEDIKIKPDDDLSEYNSLANVTETLAINDTALTDEDSTSINVQDLMVNDENEEIHQYQIKSEDVLEEINNYLPNQTKIFSDHGNSSLSEDTNLLPIITNVVSQQDLVVDDRDNICIDLTEDLSDSNDKSDQNNCDSLISKKSKVRSDLSASLFGPDPVKPNTNFIRDIETPRFENKLECHQNVVDYYGNTSNNFDCSYDPFSDYTAQYNDTNKITESDSDSDYIDVENVYNEKNEEVSMLINASGFQSYGVETSERNEELPMSLNNPEEEEQNLLSSDEDELSPVYGSNKEGLRIENTFSLNPNFARPLQVNRTLKKVPEFCRPISKLNKRKNASDKDESDDDSESETLYDVKSKTKPLQIDSRYFNMPRKTKTLSNITKNMKEFWNESLQILNDQINDPNNPNKEIFNNIEKQMDGNVNIFKYLMANQQDLYNGKLVVSENADPEVAEYFKKHLESLNNIENFSDIDVSMPSLSSPPLSKNSSTEVNFPAINIIPTTSNSISSSKDNIYTANHLSNRCNNPDETTSKTSKQIPSTRILNHSSVDSLNNSITKPNEYFYPYHKYTQCINKVTDIQHQSRPFISKPRLIINQTRPFNCSPGLINNQQRPIISHQPIVHPTFQLPTAVRSKPLSFAQNNMLYPNLNTQAVRNVSNTTSKYVRPKKTS